VAATDELAAAMAHHQAGRLAEAEALYRAIPEAAPEHGHALHLLGLIATARGDGTEALRCLRRAAALLPRFAPVHANLGDMLRSNGRRAEAVESYRRAVSLDPAVAGSWCSLGETLAMLGRTDEAISCLQTAIRLDPELIAAHSALANAGQPEGMAQLAAVLARPDLSAPDRIAAGFALATLLDRAGEWDAAFAWLEQANGLVRESMRAAGQSFDAAALRAYVDRRIAACTPEFFARPPAAGRGNASELPVFIVGMPRSGTTLVEQILASHSRVHSVGEGNDFGAIDAELTRTAGPGGYGDWDAAVCRRLADAHIAILGRDAGPAERVVDKTPDNLFHLGIIAVLFPRARVIVCRRDPRDICLSCYFQAFAEPMPYAYDLAACARRVLEVDRLTAHWRQVLPLPMHLVQYEALIADQEAESRRLIDFLGLAWEPACLDFHRGERTVLSASRWQVRQPIYTRSVQRWRHYQRHLGALLEVFGRD